MDANSQETINLYSTILTEYRDLLSVNDLCTIFDISKQTVYREISNGKFGTPIKIGRAIKIPKLFILNKYFHI